MTDIQGLFTRWWRTDMTEPPVTDASGADNYVTEDTILRFQAVSKEVTDILVKLSAADATGNDDLRKYKEAVILAYAAACEGSLTQVKKILEKLL